MAQYAAPYIPPAQRRSDGSQFVPVVMIIAALVGFGVTFSWDSMSLPGMQRVAAAIDTLPLPWKVARPIYVLTPEVTAPAAPNAAAPAPVAQPLRSVPNQVAPVAPLAPARPAIALAPIPAALRLDGFKHQWQTWNNCGPATITMALSHFGRTETQVQAAPFLKPNPNDKNVNPEELVAYARSVGMNADWRVAGDTNRLKALVANGIPVIVEMWYTPHPNDGMGHYRVIMGFDDAAQRFYAYDSYETPGLNVPLPYKSFDEDWRVFNRTYIPVYPLDKAAVVASILGGDIDDAQMWQRSLQLTEAAVATRANDAFAWFNYGTSLVALDRHADAAPAFDRARSLKLPWRMLWYQFAPFEAYLAVGRPNDVLALADANLKQTGDLEESLYYRGRALQALGNIAGARAAFQSASRANPKFAPAAHALSTLG